eukprot:scaffold74751_cov48-Phaeocystis_antarctica.AAC.1
MNLTLLAMLPLCLLLVAALGLLYHRHSQISRDRANAVLSRDRANFDLQISVQVNHKLQRAFREAQGNEGIDLQREQAQADDTASLSSSVPSRWRASLSHGKGPPSTLPPGPPSSSAGQSVVEQEIVLPAPTPPGVGTTPLAAPANAAACASVVDAQQAALQHAEASSAPPNAPPKKAPLKRAAPPESASAPSAKRASTSPWL